MLLVCECGERGKEVTDHRPGLLPADHEPIERQTASFATHAVANPAV